MSVGVGQCQSSSPFSRSTWRWKWSFVEPHLSRDSFRLSKLVVSFTWFASPFPLLLSTNARFRPPHLLQFPFQTPAASTPFPIKRSSIVSPIVYTSPFFWFFFCRVPLLSIGLFSCWGSLFPPFGAFFPVTLVGLGFLGCRASLLFMFNWRLNATSPVYHNGSNSVEVLMSSFLFVMPSPPSGPFSPPAYRGFDTRCLNLLLPAPQLPWFAIPTAIPNLTVPPPFCYFFRMGWLPWLPGFRGSMGPPFFFVKVSVRWGFFPSISITGKVLFFYGEA